MGSEPEYFYTVELPERYGRLLEKLADMTSGLFTPEEMAARLLCDAIEQAEKDDVRLPDKLSADEKRSATTQKQGHASLAPGQLDDDIPF